MDKTQQKKAQNVRDKLSQWDSRLAPLSDRQKESFMELSTAATARPFPTQVHTIVDYCHQVTPS